MSAKPLFTNTPDSIRTKFEPMLIPATRENFVTTHFSPIRVIELTDEEIHDGVSNQCTQPLKFGRSIDLDSLLGNRYARLHAIGFENHQFMDPFSISKLHLQCEGTNVVLDLKNVLSSVSRTSTHGKQPQIHILGKVAGDFHSTFISAPGSYWSQFVEPMFELDVKFCFTPDGKTKLGSVYSAGVAKFMYMEEIKKFNVTGAKFPRQYTDVFKAVKIVGFELSADVISTR